MNFHSLNIFPNILHYKPFIHVKYLKIILDYSICLVDFASSLLYYSRIFPEWQTSNGTRAQIFQKPILALKSFSKYDSTPSPSAISVPVAVYNLGVLCNQWCQNRDGTAAVGLCTVCALAPLDTAHSTTILHWTQLHWVTEDSAFVTVWLIVTDRTVPSKSAMIVRHFILWNVRFNTDVFSSILVPFTRELLYIITLNDLL